MRNPLQRFHQGDGPPPVRSGSVPAGWVRHLPAERGLRGAIHRAAEAAGLGLNPLRVLALLLFHHLNPRTGRCDPAMATLAAELGCCRMTVLRALAALEAAHFLRRTRRWTVRAGEVRQTSNAYSLHLPRWARRPAAAAAPVTQTTMTKNFPGEARPQPAASAPSDTRRGASALEAALARLGEAVRRREAAGGPAAA